jgi:hypothetical protein
MARPVIDVWEPVERSSVLRSGFIVALGDAQQLNVPFRTIRDRDEHVYARRFSALSLRAAQTVQVRFDCGPEGFRSTKTA